jgi:HEAT repeat protein
MQTTLKTALERVTELGLSGSTTGARELMAMLGSSDWQIRRAAADEISAGLESTGDGETVSLICSELIEATLNTTDAGRRSAALAALEQIGRPALPFLASALETAPASGRIALAGVIGSAGGAEAVCLLKNLSANRAEVNVAAAAINALGRTNHPSAFEAITSYSETSDDWLIFSIIGALGELGDERGVRLIEQRLMQPATQEAAATALVEIGNSKAVRALIRHVFSASGEVQPNLLCAISTLYAGERSVPRACQESLQRLIKLGFCISAKERTPADLISLAGSRDPGVARCAILALGWLGHAETVQVVVDHLSNPALTKSCRQALADLAAEPAALEVMIDLINSDLPRAELATAILHIRSVESILAATQIITSTDASETLESCWSTLSEARSWLAGDGGQRLSSGQLSRLRRALLNALKEAHGRALLEIALTIAAIPGQNSVSTVDEVLDVLSKVDAADAAIAKLCFIERIDRDSAIREAHTAQRNSDPRVRLCSVELLARTSKDPAPLLQHATDESTAVRRAAIRTMGTAKFNNESLRALRAATEDPDVWVRAEAIKSLGTFFWDSAEVFADLRLALSNSHPLCRVAAVQAIATNETNAGPGLSEEKATPVWLEMANVARNDSQSEVRRVAARSFLTSPFPEIVRQVAKTALMDETWSVQLAGIDLFSKLDDPMSTRHLLRAATDQSRNSAVRGAAIRALAVRGHSRAAQLACDAVGAAEATLVEEGFEALRLISVSNRKALRGIVDSCPPRAASVIRFILEESPDRLEHMRNLEGF